MPNQKSDDRSSQQGNKGGNPNQGQQSGQGQVNQSGTGRGDMGNQGQRTSTDRGNQPGQQGNEQGNMPDRERKQGQQEKTSSNRDASSYNDEQDTEQHKTSNSDKDTDRGMSNH